MKRLLHVLLAAVVLALTAQGQPAVAAGPPAMRDHTRLAGAGAGTSRFRGRGYARPSYRYRRPHRPGYGRGFFHGLFTGWFFSHFFGYGFGLGVPLWPFLLILLFAFRARRSRRR